MARRVVRLLIEELPQILRVTKNIWNNEAGDSTRGGSPAWGLGDLRTNHHKKCPCY